MTFSAEIKASVGWDWEDGAVDNDRTDYLQQLPQGNGDGEAEAVWHIEEQTLPAGATATLDMTALVRQILGDANAVTMTSVKALLLTSDAESAGTLVVGGAVGAAWSEPFAADADQAIVAPDGLLLLCNPGAGWPVDADHRLLLLSASGGDVIYSAVVVGTLTAAGSGSGSGA